MPASDLISGRKTINYKLYKRGIIAVVVIAILYTSVWYFLANKVEEKVSDQLALYNENGFVVLCENMHKIGYPLRIGVSCDTVNLQQLMKGFAFSSEKIIAGAPVYAPHWLELSLTAPVSLELPGLIPFSAKWSGLTVETDMSQPIPDAVSLRAEDIEIGTKADAGALVNKTTGKFLRFDAHGFNSNLDARLTFEDLKLPVIIPHENTPVPQMTGDIRWSLNEAVSLFQTEENAIMDQHYWFERLRGHKGTLQPSTVRFASGGAMTVSGPFSFNDEGYLSAKLDIAVSDQNKLLQTARDAFPSQADNLKTIFFALNAMPKNEKGDPVLQLSVKNGEVRLGFFKIGHIDPL
ncbi:DUF2125 domain-containing protein [uncultured Bartonella sp.]|uniref:DUF2125 domain-containing protein n=1 Tax=uncultured Bartonella sp. TaxID=104108 RepID=UPI0025E87751|nr:DUF2125 domain-containing protein [uncultured Bartonella sp.]